MDKLNTEVNLGSDDGSLATSVTNHVNAVSGQSNNDLPPYLDVENNQFSSGLAEDVSSLNINDSHHHRHHHHHHHNQYITFENISSQDPPPSPPPVPFGQPAVPIAEANIAAAAANSISENAAVSTTTSAPTTRIRSYRSSISATPSATPSGGQSLVNSQSSTVSTAGGTSAASSASGGGGTILVSTSASTAAAVQQQQPGPAKWVTREIAALEFLLEGIPLQAERSIVHEGYLKLKQSQEETTKKPSSPTAGADTLASTANKNDAATATAAVPTMPAHHRQGRWWEKWIASTAAGGPTNNNTSSEDHDATGLSRESHIEDLEGPGENPSSNERYTGGQSQHRQHPQSSQQHQQQQMAPLIQVPGRRLEGDPATKVQIPVSADKSIQTRQRSIARKAKLREWELRVAHGLADVGSGGSRHERNKSQLQSQQQKNQYAPPLLDGRMFFSAKESYPIQVFSLLRYEPKKEEAARRRQKLEARGGGGTQFFIMPGRDWRGISYRALLPGPADRHESARWQHDRFVSDSDIVTPKNPIDGDDDDDDRSDSEVEEEDTYAVGLLDDPGMTFGRHRNVMIGDRSTGPIVSSTIQFVKPKLLKADLNQQFRARFDGWEPPKSQHKYIGAKVVNGLYTLMDPTFDSKGQGGSNDNIALLDDEETIATTPTLGTSTSGAAGGKSHHTRQASISSQSTGGAGEKENIRMPPSLTLSKIRSLKAQALGAAVKAKLEISTVALAIIYFERLCLDCRVDKTNRRLSFAACLLLAIKINESHVGVVQRTVEDDSTSVKTSHVNRIQSLVRPNKKSNTMFASLLEFFTQEWNLSLKHLFAAEWGVFAALQFRLQAKPSHVAFHFKRLMKALEWDPRRYLGNEMYTMWQQSLADEEQQRIEREQRIEARRQWKEEKKLLRLRQELEAANRLEKSSRSFFDHDEDDNKNIDGSGKHIMNHAVIQIFALNDTEEHKKDAVEKDGKNQKRGKSQGRIGRIPFRSHTSSPVQRSKSGDQATMKQRSPRNIPRPRGPHRAGGLGDLLTMLSGTTSSGGGKSHHEHAVGGSATGGVGRRGSPIRAKSTDRSWGKKLKGGHVVTAQSSSMVGGTGGTVKEIAHETWASLPDLGDESSTTSEQIKKSISMSALSSIDVFDGYHQDDEKQNTVTSHRSGADFDLSQAISLDDGDGRRSRHGGGAKYDFRNDRGSDDNASV